MNFYNLYSYVILNTICTGFALCYRVGWRLQMNPVNQNFQHPEYKPQECLIQRWIGLRTSRQSFRNWSAVTV